MEDIVSVELAKKLQKKGFPLRQVAVQDGSPIFFDLPMDHPEWHQCDAWYLPTIAQVLKWLREEKKLFILPRIDDLGWCYSVHTDLYWDGCGSLVRSSYHAKSYFETYEEAMLAGIGYVLDNLI